MKNIINALAFVLLPILVYAQTPIFTGTPIVKVSEGGIERVPEIISKKEAKNLRCTIRENEGRYYWVTRGDKEMLQHAQRAFTTYVAVDGSGYVRIIKPSFKEAASLMSPTESKYDYVEHMLIGLRSVTYFGVAH